MVIHDVSTHFDCIADVSGVIYSYSSCTNALVNTLRHGMVLTSVKRCLVAVEIICVALKWDSNACIYSSQKYFISLRLKPTNETRGPKL